MPRSTALRGFPGDFIGGHGPEIGSREGIPGRGLPAPDGEQGLRRIDPETFHLGEGSEMAKGCSSPSGSGPGVGAVVALIPSVHPGLRFPNGDPQGAPSVFRQLANRKHSRCLMFELD